MKKPVIALGLKGVLIKPEAWEKAQDNWFAHYAQKLEDDSILTWSGREDYFQGVEEVMKRVMPDATDDERTVRAREEYHQHILEWIHHNEGVRTRMVNVLAAVKDRARVVVVTSTEEKIAHTLLTLIPKGIIHATYGSRMHEKDDKQTVFERMLSHEEKPVLYVGSGRHTTQTICSRHSIPSIDAEDMSAQELQAAVNDVLE